MLQATTHIAGSPSFLADELAACAREHGVEAAWRRAFASTGPAAAADVGGDFAVAVREPGGRIILAVDRFAVQTLCYSVVDGELHYAERADDLADLTGAALDPQAIFDYLYFHAIPSPRTVYEGVRRLPPAHYALFEDGRLTVAPYWVPEFADEGLPDASLDALRTRFHAVLRGSVARQLDGSTPACFLSGGTDSSTVAGLIGEVAGRPAVAYSIGFDAEGYDEMEYARIAARHFGTEHREYYVTPDDLVRGIPDVAASVDQPFGNSSTLPAYYCALAARRDGVTRLLAGDGGDELFGGNTRYAKQRVFGWYGAVPAPLRRGLLEPAFASPLGRMPLLRKGASYIEQARVDMPDRMEMYNLLLRLGVGNVLEKDFVARICVDAPARERRAVWQQAVTADALNRNLAFDWRYTLAENDLPKVRSATRLAGVEVGFPLLDRELVDFSLTLPADYKLKGLKLRWFFKEALRGFLPDATIVKKKQGFGLPFGVWLTRHEGLKRLAADSLASLATRRIVRADFIRELLDRRLAEHPGYYGEMVWILMMLEQWLGSRRRHAFV